VATITIDAGVLTVRIEGLDKLWSFQSQLQIPLAHVRGASTDPAVIGRPEGWRGPGSRIPGVITAGTFHHDGTKVFWDVHDMAKAVAIEVEHDVYERLVIEVDDPRATAELIERALAQRAG
jgi:hypothetical protein